MQVLLTTCGSWHLRQTARAFQERGALAGLWISDKNSTGLPSDKYHRCWPFHLAMKPFYRLTPDSMWVEKPFHALFPLWRWWLKRQAWPRCDVVQAVMGFATEPFDWADQHGALKVIDVPNSHPTTYYGNIQRECDLWCPGEKMPIPRWMFARMNRELERADLVVVQSKFCEESMVMNGIPREKVLVNPMGVDAAVFKKREAVPTKPRFICVGMICLRKGQQYLFRAFQLVKKQIPEAELICVGAYRPDFAKERPRWKGTFTHYNNLSHAELAELLQTCTAFVFPSQEEGIARAQIEALASGLPVIGTHAGGATTLVRDGVEGFIVSSHDVRQIADAMIRLAQDRALNQRMGEAACLKGAERNTWQDYGDRLLAEYKRLLERRLTGAKAGGAADGSG
jgi:glycosyltransferase involved in cell wall biosynthesis